MNDEVYWTLACKVWENKASPAETEQFNAWVQQPGHAAKLAEYRQLWQITAPGSILVFDARENWGELEGRLHANRERSFSPFLLWAKIAASLLLLAVAWFYLPRLFADELVTIRTQVAQQKLVVLPDSSYVWLNASSTIRYPKAFSDSRRQVYLEGEAFFDVTKDAARPFIIDSKDTETRVLGTSFHVQAVAALPVTVTVVTGKVQFGPLADAHRRVMLLPGDAGTFHAQGTLTSKANDNPRFMEWHNRTLYFSKTPLTQVFETLENVYGIRIHTSRPPSKACVFTGAFENAPVEEIFEVLSATVGFEWSGSEKKYQVVNLNCL